MHFFEKLSNAQREGALAVVVISDHRPRVVMGCGASCGSGISIPAFMLDNGPGSQIRSILEGGGSVTVALDPARRVVTDVLATLMCDVSKRWRRPFSLDVSVNAIGIGREGGEVVLNVPTEVESGSTSEFGASLFRVLSSPRTT